MVLFYYPLRLFLVHLVHQISDLLSDSPRSPLQSVPLSMANALEPVRNADDISLNGESAEEAAQAPAGGLLSGFQILNVHIDTAGGLN